jgi:hypothetical protein
MVYQGAKGMKSFSVKQLNNLLIGTSLAVEIPSSSEELRAFIVVSSTVSKRDKGYNYLNKKNKDIEYCYRKYEIPKEYIENDWDVSDDELINSIHITGIKNIKELEEKLCNYIEDLSVLEGEWKCDNPI